MKVEAAIWKVRDDMRHWAAEGECAKNRPIELQAVSGRLRLLLTQYESFEGKTISMSMSELHLPFPAKLNDYFPIQIFHKIKEKNNKKNCDWLG